MRRTLLLIVVVLLNACGPSPTTPSQSIPAPQTEEAGAVPVTPTPPHNTVDATTMQGKLLMGYQGWFSCPEDGMGNGWEHWFNGDIPDADHFRVDMWPDASELTPSERCETQMEYPDGTPAYLYSANNPATVMRHFQWMNEYGIDGVFLERFVKGLSQPNIFDKRNRVTENVRQGSETYGRVFAIEYDISRPDSNFVSQIKEDWIYLVDVMKVTESPAYLHHKGRPVLGIFGLGLNFYQTTPAQAMELVEFFKNNPDPRYRVTLMAGVPGGWRTLTEDSLPDQEWAEYYCSLDIISPWTVGRYRTDEEVDHWSNRMRADMVQAKQCGADYMPVVWPGTSFHNSEMPGSTGTPFNQIPRRGGRLYWRQVYDAISIGAPMIFNAMFDEVDEDTAMYKLAATVNDQPAGVELVSMDADGEALPNDWYLHLAGAATQMLRGNIPLTPGIPLNPDGSLVTIFELPEPAPAGQVTMRVQIVSTADWTTLDLLGGGQWMWMALVSASPEASMVAADLMPIGLNQTLDRARAGQQVEMIVDIYLSNVQAGAPLNFEIQRGSIGKTTVSLFRMNALTNDFEVVDTVTWAGMNDNIKNPYPFSVPSEPYLPDAP